MSDTTGATTVWARHALRRSPFDGHAPGTHAAAAGRIGVRLQARILHAVALVATWHSGIAALEQALSAAVSPGTAPPQRTGQAVRLGALLLMRTGPEEFMLVAERAADLVRDLRVHVKPDIGSVTDLGHARCAIRIDGDRCRDTLSKLFALDLREAAFPVGEIRLTGHHHVPCTVHRLGTDRFDLYVFTTYAHDQLGTLLDAAREFGVKLESEASGSGG